MATICDYILISMQFFINNILFYRNYSSSTLDNLKSFSPEFIQWFVGFADAESNFFIKVNLSKKTVQPMFQIGLHIDDLPLLEFIKNTLKVGRISVDSKNSKANWVVSSYKDLIQIILPIFDSFSLNSSKYLNFVLFKEVVVMIERKEHLTIMGFQKIISIKEKMNKNSVDISMFKDHQIKITIPWLIGLIEGDGTFSTNKLVPRLSIQLTLKEEASIFFIFRRGALLARLRRRSLAIRDFFGIGYIHYEKPRNRSLNEKPMVQLEFNNVRFLFNFILKEFNSFSMFSKKKLDFNDWAIIVKLYYFGYHLLPSGKSLIEKLKARMNAYRLSTNLLESESNLTDSILQQEIEQIFNLPFTAPY